MDAGLPLRYENGTAFGGVPVGVIGGPPVGVMGGEPGGPVPVESGYGFPSVGALRSCGRGARPLAEVVGNSGSSPGRRRVGAACGLAGGCCFSTAVAVGVSSTSCSLRTIL